MNVGIALKQMGKDYVPFACRELYHNQPNALRCRRVLALVYVHFQKDRLGVAGRKRLENWGDTLAWSAPE